MPLNDQTLFQILKNIFISQEGGDVTFIVHGKELQAHKFILTARSPVFKAMIEGPMAPSNQRHEINDLEITFEHFYNFLLFLYTDEYVADEKSNFKALFHLANFYDVQYLQSKCVNDALLFMDKNNVFEYAELGLQYSLLSPLLQKCFAYFVTDYWDIQLTYRNSDNSLVWISPELTLELVKQCPRFEGSFTEDGLFYKVFEWAKNECIRQKQKATPENIQAILAPIMPHFNFNNFSPLILATTVKDFKLLPSDQLNECLANHIIKAADKNLPEEDRQSFFQRDAYKSLSKKFKQFDMNDLVDSSEKQSQYKIWKKNTFK